MNKLLINLIIILFPFIAHAGTELELGYYRNSGNVVKESFYSSFGIHYRKGVNEFNIQAYTKIANSDNKTNEEKYHSSIKYDRHLSDSVSVFILKDAEKNRFKRLNLRLNAGKGLKYTFMKDKIKNLSLSGAVLYELTKYTDHTSNQITRLSIRPKIKYVIFNKIELTSVFFYQPNLEYFDDYRLSFKSFLKIPISKLLSLKVTHTLDFDSQPITEVTKKDSSFMTSLVVNF